MKKILFSSLILSVAVALTGCFSSSSSSSSDNGGSASVNVSGNWRLFASAPGEGEEVVGTMRLQQSGSSVQGELDYGDGDLNDVVAGSISGDRFRGTVVEPGWDDWRVEFDVRVDGDRMQGTAVEYWEGDAFSFNVRLVRL